VTNNFETLLAALSSMPRLDGALCRDEWELWDEYDDPEITEYTVNQCLSCPALKACRAHFDALPKRKRPPGVIAGQINRPPEARKPGRPCGRPRKTEVAS
jgi:WhiB family redox-sensing transcriptional regulator